MAQDPKAACIVRNDKRFNRHNKRSTGPQVSPMVMYAKHIDRRRGILLRAILYPIHEIFDMPRGLITGGVTFRWPWEIQHHG